MEKEKKLDCIYCHKTAGTYPINVTTPEGRLSICGKCIKKWFDCMSKFENLEAVVKQISDNVKIG